MGWAVLANGLLLKAAEGAGFEIMLTCDQNISYQQNLQDRSLALVVLTTNNWNRIKPYTHGIGAAIGASHTGSFVVVSIE